MSFDALTNRGEYLSAHYLAEVLPAALKKGQLAEWAAAEKRGVATPRQGLRALRQTYFAVKSDLVDLNAEATQADGTRAYIADRVREFHARLLDACGFTSDRRDDGRVAVVECGWAVDCDEAADADGAGRLLDPVEVDPRRRIETGFALATHLFTGDEPPRYALILAGGVMTLADRHTWAEGRYLAVSLDAAFGRNDSRPGGELDVIAALFGADSLLPPPEGGDEKLATLVGESRQHAVGVSSELREGLRLSVELIANAVLERIREQGVDPVDLMDPRELARELSSQSLRYLYRILFLLYAEARPELGVLPVDDPEYMAGYSLARLGELVSRKLGGEQARRSFHLHESLDLLFRMVNEGHNPRITGDEPVSEGTGLRFEPLMSDLFRPARTRLIGPSAFVHPDDDDAAEPRMLDTRLRNATLYQVLRLLMRTRGRRNQRGGFISYRMLGINQLGAVYEGLMSFTGFIAAEELYEVAKGGDAKDGSWMIPASRADDYPDEVFVTTVDDETGARVRSRYATGSFVYRLAGRDRQTSASHYTPQSLTEVTVQLVLQARLDQDDTVTPARELLEWTICEPALGSGAFLNEAINQVAAEYLRRRQAELGVSIDPDQHAVELQRVKTYIALHNCYGVDLNRTAVELAEVSLWLNVMHHGLRAPWFGLHLRRGNSLIGARRQFYTSAQIADKSWLETAPTAHPLRSTNPLPAGAVHHFLLPADGWGAIAGAKEAKIHAPEAVKSLADWRRGIKSKPTTTQARRLHSLASRVELLWDLVRQRLALSEQAIRRDIAVWGADDLPAAERAGHRDQIKADLEAEGGPYWRLKTLMDAWCALWFWPLDQVGHLDGTDPRYRRDGVITHVTHHVADDQPALDDYEPAALFETGGSEQLTLALRRTPKKPAVPRPRRATLIETLAQATPLSSLADWLDVAEAIIGRASVPTDSLVDHFSTLAQLDAYEEDLPRWMGSDPHFRLFERFPWLDVARRIAREQGFFHWEVEFAHAFARGGFDLQVGNPPWVRPRWQEDRVLAEHDPWFVLAHKPSVDQWNDRKSTALAQQAVRDVFLAELAANAGVVASLGSGVTYPLLTGTQPDLYRAFMCQVWAHQSPDGTSGLIHPDTHFGGVKEGALRASAYRHLRIHADFVNEGNWAFPSPVNNSTHFGLHIYGHQRAVEFLHLTNLYGARVLPASLLHDGLGSAPGLKWHRQWDLRPHQARVVRVTTDLLRTWGSLTQSAADVEPERCSLLFPVTVHEERAIAALAEHDLRLGSANPLITRGFDEANAKKDGLIEFHTEMHDSIDAMILQGPHLGTGTPYAKDPRELCRVNHDWDPVDLTTSDEGGARRTNYRRACDEATYLKAQDVWHSKPNTEFFRLAWRRMIPTHTERSLFAALIPPGPTHVDAVHSLALSTNKKTALNAGFWASLPLDYLLRITGRSDLRVAEAKAMPAADPGHPLASALLLRTLRLNCLTRHYEPLWSELYSPTWTGETWVVGWPGLPPLGDVTPDWRWETPLRTERARRAALVEIDALVAVWLGIGVDELIAVLRSRYPILTDREDEMWFDAAGRRVARDPYAYGFGQEKGVYEDVLAHLDAPSLTPPPDGYAAPFYRADREDEYRQAHAAFSARLRAAKANGWEPTA